MPITGLSVTYNSVLADTGFHRVTTTNGGSANINEHNDSSVSSYLWFTDSPSAGEPITQVQILDSGQEVPEGFEKLKRNLTKGAAARKFLCVERGGQETPINEVKVVYGEETLSDDYEAVSGDLSIGDTRVRLFVRRSGGEGAWSGFSLQLEDWVDCRDTEDVWRVAQVISMTEDSVTVHYKNWGSKWDETLPKTSAKLAQIGSHTSGRDTGWTKRQQGGIWDVSLEAIERFREKLEANAEQKRAEPESNEGFWKVELPNFVEDCLTSNFEDDAVLPAVVELMRGVMDVILHEMEHSAAPVSLELLQQLRRLSSTDPQCSFFYNHYGGDKQLADQLETSTEYIALRRGHEQLYLLAAMMNYMGRRGGFEILRARIDPEPLDGPQCSLRELDTYCRVLSYFRLIYKKSFQHAYFEDFHEVVFARLRRVSDEELKELNAKGGDVIQAIVTTLDTCIKKVRPDVPIGEHAERFRLFIARRQIACPFLNMRIRGVTALNAVVNKVVAKDASRGG